MNNLNYLDNFFFANYFKRNGFWYAFKRSVNDINNLHILLKYCEGGLNMYKADLMMICT